MADGDPLAGLNDIDWARLNCAYGDGRRVATVLRLLASDKASDADAAWDQLNDQFLWHQGSVYAATVAAVRFLVAITAREATHRRPRLVSYLALLSLARESKESPAFAQQVRDAVRRELPSLRDLLNTTDRGLGLSVAELVAALPFDMPHGIELVARLLAVEPNSRIRAALCGTSASLGDQSPTVLTALQKIEAESVRPGYRLPGGLTVLPPKERLAAGKVAQPLEEIATLPIFSAITQWAGAASPGQEDESFFDAARLVNTLFNEAAGNVVWAAP